MRHRLWTLALAAAACATAGKGGPADAGRAPDAGNPGSGEDGGTPPGITNPGQALSLWGGLPRCGSFFVPADQSPQSAAHDNNVLWSGLYSDSSPLYLTPAQPGPADPVRVRLRALANDLTAANVVLQSALDGSSVTLPLARETALDSTGRFEFWSTTLPASPAPRRYRFQAIDGRASAWLNGCGQSAQEPNSQDFWIVPGFAPPTWAQGAVLYQVFPDRFYNGDPTNDPINGAPLLGGAQHVTFDSNWNDPPQPTSYLFFGGDLNGVAQKLAYLRDLGVDGIYLNPIFLAPSNHKYDTQDYTQVDPIFGGEAALQTLLSAAHDTDAGTLRVVLDGVFNHVGLGEPWFDFYSLYTTLGADKGGVKQPSSPWYDRFTFLSHDVDGCDYAHFQTSCPLVKLDYGSPELKADMFGDGGVVSNWLGAVGADGFRLDAVDLIGTGGVDGQDNAQLLEALRASAKNANPDSELIGEPGWGLQTTQWLLGDQLDGVMNYQGFGSPVSEFVNQVDIGGNSNTLNATGFDSAIRGALAEAPYPADLTKWNSLSTHDISRFLTRAGGDHWRLFLGTFLQMTLPGSPVVYYGDEIGMQGASDPYNRHTFDWNQADWDTQARSLTQTLIAARHALPALQSGGMMTLLANNATGVYAFARMLSDKGGQVIVVVNSSGATAAAFQLPVWYASLADGATLTDRVSGQVYTVTNGMISVSGLLGHYGLVLSP